jgi:hypothetical protein
MFLSNPPAEGVPKQLVPMQFPGFHQWNMRQIVLAHFATPDDRRRLDFESRK